VEHSEKPDQPTRRVSPVRIETKRHAPNPQSDPGEVIVEAPLTLDVQGVGPYTILAAPTDSIPLTVGFLFAEGIIGGVEDIVLLQRCEDDAGVIRVRLADPSAAAGRERNLMVVSACGLCGSQSIDELLGELPRAGEELVVAPAVLRQAVTAMRERQDLFRQTGGAHAAALFDRQGAVVSFAEDIGRHNALDKAVGKCLLESRAPAGHGAALSGRVSLELVAKCARAGIELIAAVSAPTSLALDAAERCNITLCAFVRETRATVYCHPQRILNLA
jgi:FdhD protein